MSVSQFFKSTNFEILLVHCRLALKNAMISGFSAISMDSGYSTLRTEAIDDLYPFKVEGEK